MNDEIMVIKSKIGSRKRSRKGLGCCFSTQMFLSTHRFAKFVLAILQDDTSDLKKKNFLDKKMETDQAFTTRPLRTLYINNLNTNLNKEDTTRLLYSFYSQFGSLLDIVVSRHPKHRGQAYVSFRDLSAASNAIHGSHSFPLGGKPMKVAFAKRDSDAVAEYLGTGNAMLRKKQQDKRSKGVIEVGNGIVLKKSKKDNDKNNEEENLPKKTSETLIGDEEAPKNQTLFVENLPIDRTEEQIKVLFNQFEGFKEVRLNESRKDICFVEFDDSFRAERAKKALNGFDVSPTNIIKVTFARM